MRLARYHDRIMLTISEKEYVAAHRKFGFNAGRLRAVHKVRMDKDSHYLEVKIDNEAGLAFSRNVRGDWSVGWSVKKDCPLPVFGITDVGKFDPDSDGCELIFIPEKPNRLIPRGLPPKAMLATAPAETIFVSEKPIPLLEETPKFVSAVEPPAPICEETKVTFTQKLRAAVKLLNRAVDLGFKPEFDKEGKIIKINVNLDI